MEAVGQDIVDQSLADLVKRLRYLGADLASNGAAGTAREKTIAELIGRFDALRKEHLGRARALLRRGLAEPAAADRGVSEPRAEPAALLSFARAEIETVARDLGSILLRAGMSYAMEVFTHELGDLAGEQEAVLAASVELAANLPAGGEAVGRALAGRQRQVAARAERLLAETSTIAYGGTQALAAVRLSQARKQLLEAGFPKRLEACAEGLGRAAANRGLSEPRAEPAALLSFIEDQRGAVRALRQTEARLRPEAVLEDLVRGRGRLRGVLQDQQQVRAAVEAAPAAEWPALRVGLAARQDALRHPLLGLAPMLATDEFVGQAGAAVIVAFKAIEAGRRDEALAAQGRAEDALQDAVAALDQRIARLQRTDEAYLRLKGGTERLRALMVMEDRQEQLLDAASALAGRKEPTAHLAAGQRRLGAGVEDFAGRIPPDATNWSAMMPVPLARAVAHMRRAAERLGARPAEEALSSQDEALGGLKEAVGLAEKEVSYLEQIWTLMRVAGDLKQFAALTQTIGHEQEDVRVATERAAASGGTVLDLTGRQQVLDAALAEMRELVAGLEEARAFDNRLAEAGAAAAEAAAHLGRDQAAPAVAAQKRAEQEFQAAAETALAMAQKIEHATEYLASVEQMLADVIGLLRLQVRLRKETEVAEAPEFPRLAGEQDVLRGDTGAFADWFERLRSSRHFRTAHDAMGSGVASLKAGTRDEAVGHQKRAEEALRLGIKELDELIESLLAAMGGGDWYEEVELRYGPLIFEKIVVLIVRQRGLRTAVQAARPAQVAKYGDPQAELQAQAAAFVAENEPSPVMDCVRDAAAEMGRAAGSLKQALRDEGIGHQQQAEKHLRRGLTLMVLSALEALMQGTTAIGASRNAGLLAGEGMITLFAKQNPSDQQAVTADKSEFDPLGKRDRDALNEYFARELPLEFRGLLKNYYEALSR